MRKGDIDPVISLFFLLLLFVGVFVAYQTYTFFYTTCISSQNQEIVALRKVIEEVDKTGGYKYEIFNAANCVDCAWFDTSTSELKIKYSLRIGIAITSQIIPYPIPAEFVGFGCNCENCDLPTKGCANINETKMYTLKIEEINNIVHVNCTDCPNSTQSCTDCLIYDEIECQAKGCFWCQADINQCKGNKYASNPDVCVQHENLCNYHCEYNSLTKEGKCGAECAIDIDCPSGSGCHPEKCKCIDCSIFGSRPECTSNNCIWCDQCDENKQAANPSICVLDKELCEYRCVQWECGADCANDFDCPSGFCDKKTCTCTDLD